MVNESCPHGGIHDHGTLSCAVRDKCACPACEQVYADYRARRARQIAYGQWRPLRDSAPVRDHLVQLRRAGLSLATIAEQTARAGTPVSRHTLKALVYGRPGRSGTYVPPSRVRAETAAAILRVRPPRQEGPRRIAKVLHLAGARLETIAAIRVGREQGPTMVARDLGMEDRTARAGALLALRSAIGSTYDTAEMPATERAMLTSALGQCGLNTKQLAQLTGVSARTVLRDQAASCEERLAA